MTKLAQLLGQVFSTINKKKKKKKTLFKKNSRSPESGLAIN
jgi:hypothetical protein